MSQVLFDELTGKHATLGIITLNRPEALNSINLSMIHAIHAQLKKWASDNAIKAVVIKAAEGRAFCAGGDLRFTFERREHQDAPLTDFFHDEYQLNRYIYHYPKPYIALLDGITMGGGVGISIHGSHRVATEHLMFAMPETGIGFFPDVGGTFFLPRLAHKIGWYLGLTGARIHTADCMALGITQFHVERKNLNNLLTKLSNASFKNNAYETVDEILTEFSIPNHPAPLFEQAATIEEFFKASDVEMLIEKLRDLSSALAQETLKMLAKKSPTSLKVTWQALQRGETLDFDTCMQQEYRLANHFIRGHDFFEGIRAVIIDKDQAPRWQPATLQAISDVEVEQYFAPITKELA